MSASTALPLPTSKPGPVLVPASSRELTEEQSARVWLRIEESLAAEPRGVEPHAYDCDAQHADGQMLRYDQPARETNLQAVANGRGVRASGSMLAVWITGAVLFALLGFAELAVPESGNGVGLTFLAAAMLCGFAAGGKGGR